MENIYVTTLPPEAVFSALSRTCLTLWFYITLYSMLTYCKCLKLSIAFWTHNLVLVLLWSKEDYKLWKISTNCYLFNWSLKRLTALIDYVSHMNRNCPALLMVCTVSTFVTIVYWMALPLKRWERNKVVWYAVE